MRKLRVMVLMHEELVPPDDVADLSEAEVRDFKTERDVLWALGELGHERLKLGVRSDLAVIRQALQDFKPDITFNVLEEFHGVSLYGGLVIGHLELLRAAYTGCNPRGLMLAHDKILTKKILAYHRIRTPRFALFPVGVKVRRPQRLAFPLMVKSSVEDASLGIAQASVVTSDEKLVERVAFMHEAFGTDVMAEEFIEGRELYVGVLGNTRLQLLPVWEMTFARWEEGQPRIATARVKWDLEYQKKKGIDTGPAQDLPEGLERAIARTAKLAYRALGLSGYARLDMRLAPDGTLHVIEINANPDLARDEDFAASAAAAGLTYPELVARILSLGLAYRPLWKAAEEDTA
jgi:D-alanine-D-alanine ligase